MSLLAMPVAGAWAPPALAPAQPRPLPPASASLELAWFTCLTAPTDDERSRAHLNCLSAHLDFARAAWLLGL